jgi:hypothetical protein
MDDHDDGYTRLVVGVMIVMAYLLGAWEAITNPRQYLRTRFVRS